MENTENNKLIAEFMGHQVRTRTDGTTNMMYDKSWDCLIPVVEKIEQTGFEVSIVGISCKINRLLDRDNPIVSWVCGDKSNKIGLTYKTILEFIKWHNGNTDTKN